MVTITDQSPQDKFLTTVRQIGFQRTGSPSYALCKAWEQDFSHQFPDATPAELERALRVIATSAGVNRTSTV